MTEQQQSPHQYRLAHIEGEQGSVVLYRHTDRPLWWRTIAVFATEARAREYVEIENDCVPDRETPDTARYEEIEQPPRQPEPPSGFDRVVVLPAEDALPRHAAPPEPPLPVEPPAPEPKAAAPQPELKPALAAVAAKPKDKPAAAKPAGITRPEQLLNWLNGLRKAGQPLPEVVDHVAKLADIPRGSLGYAWDQLEKKGRIKRLEDGQRWGVRFPDRSELWTPGGAPQREAETGFQAVDRRCPVCSKVFRCTNIDQVNCPQCDAVSAQTPILGASTGADGSVAPR